MYTLVVVDMQPLFHAANGKRVRKNCLREILQAIKDKAPIIFLEFDGYDCTHQELTKPAASYDNYYVSLKQDDDGSEEVEELVRKYSLPKYFRVCGINTDCCVYSTVRGLSGRFQMSNIDVIADACDSDWNHLSGLSRIDALKGLVSVKNKEENKCE